MGKIIILFLIFFKIGAFSFGGGYAMLPFIQQEFIDTYQYINQQEFIDLLAISQSTPGPIAINCATFVGYKAAGIMGSIAATIGVCLFSFVGLIYVSKLLTKFKENAYINRLLKVLRPITIGFILAAGFSSALEIKIEAYTIIAFVLSFVLLYTKKVGPIA
ncbi:MAG: chromate transporter, partial [Bacillaceae bacterium]